MYRIIHHNDNDGWASAAQVYWHLRNQDVPDLQIELHEVTYSTFDKGVINYGDVVYMADFSAPPEVMEHINKISSFHWIDHHKSAIEAMEQYNPGYSIPGIRQSGIAACVLTHEYLNGRAVQAPKNVRWLGLYDVWNKTVEDWDKVLAHQTGFSALGWSSDPRDSMWEVILNDCLWDDHTFDHCLEIGTVLNSARRKWDAKSMEQSYDRVLEVSGNSYNAIVFNGGRGSTQFASRWNPEKYDLMVAWRYDGMCYNYSFYSDKDDIDCSEIAKTFGGGGHKGAAGCTSETLIV